MLQFANDTTMLPPIEPWVNDEDDATMLLNAISRFTSQSAHQHKIKDELNTELSRLVFIQAKHIHYHRQL
jgi:hypothetical protein